MDHAYNPLVLDASGHEVSGFEDGDPEASGFEAFGFEDSASRMAASRRADPEASGFEAFGSVMAAEASGPEGRRLRGGRAGCVRLERVRRVRGHRGRGLHQHRRRGRAPPSAQDVALADAPESGPKMWGDEWDELDFDLDRIKSLAKKLGPRNGRSWRTIRPCLPTPTSRSSSRRNRSSSPRTRAICPSTSSRVSRASCRRPRWRGTKSLRRRLRTCRGGVSRTRRWSWCGRTKSATRACPRDRWRCAGCSTRSWTRSTSRTARAGAKA